ncbi:rod shape-determining protein MreC [Oscillospiraceae bacterium HV4-5-C5C]|nr:rod shape-determining protein MreC [Oscillospiraceae bacterium HV4-5-C5C]
MSKFKFNRFSLVVLIVVLILGLFIWSLFPGSPVDALFTPVSAVLEPVQQGFIKIRTRLSDTWTAINDGVGLSEENRTLQEENAKLEQEVRTLTAENQKYQELKDALKIKSAYDDLDVTHASLLSEGFSDWFDAFRIDIGSSDDQRLATEDTIAVVDSQMALIGRIQSSDLSSSKVLPLLNPGFVVSGKVNRTSGAQVRVHGDALLKASGLCMVDQIPENSTLTAGDEIITSGEGGIYPAGILLGKISAVHRSSGGNWAELEPYVDFDSLSDVFLLIPETQSQAAETTAATTD